METDLRNGSVERLRGKMPWNLCQKKRPQSRHSHLLDSNLKLERLVPHVS